MSATALSRRSALRALAALSATAALPAVAMESSDVRSLPRATAHGFLKAQWPAATAGDFIKGLDPQIAVGQHHVLVHAGNEIGLFDKAGQTVPFPAVRRWWANLDEFHFTISGGVTFAKSEKGPGFGPGDTRLMYDAYRHRYWVVTQYNSGNNPLSPSPIALPHDGPLPLVDHVFLTAGYPFFFVVSISETSDPRGNWRSYRFPATRPPFDPTEGVDFPCIGIDAKCFFYTANVFDQSKVVDKFGDYKYTQIFIADATALANGAKFIQQSRFAVQGFTTMPVVNTGDQPTYQSQGSAKNVAYFASLGAPNTILVNRLIYDPNDVSTITGFQGTYQVGTSKSEGVPPYASQKQDGLAKGSPVPKALMGGSRIITGARLHGNTLYVTSTDSAKYDRSTRGAIRLTCIGLNSAFEVNPSPIVDRVFGPEAGHGYDYGFPAIGVNKDGAVGIVALRSSAATFPEICVAAFYTSTGTLTPMVKLPTADATLWGEFSRLGDMCATSVDPDGITVWVAGHDGKQQVWVARLFQ